MKFKSTLFCAVALLAACKPARPAATASDAPPPPLEAPAAETPVPREGVAEAFPGCTWGEVTGAGLSIWSFTCADDRLVADPALPGFQRETKMPDGTVLLAPAVQLFTKAADAPLASIIDAVRAASPGAETCEIEPGSHDDFVLMPTGEALAAYQKFIEGAADGPALPCGPLGPKEAGGVTFRLVSGAPDKVAMINWSSDVSLYDPDTLKAAPQ